jgi:hypothetical protein
VPILQSDGNRPPIVHPENLLVLLALQGWSIAQQATPLMTAIRANQQRYERNLVGAAESAQRAAKRPQDTGQSTGAGTAFANGHAAGRRSVRHRYGALTTRLNRARLREPDQARQFSGELPAVSAVPTAEG